MRILIVKLGSIGDIVHTLPALAAMRRALPDSEISWVVERRAAEILRDNPLLDRLIEVDTKALRRGLMSGETLRAPRQQLRRLRASAFDLLPKSPAIARLSGARCVFRFLGETLCKAAIRPSQSGFLAIQKNVQVIRKNLAWVAMPLGTRNSGAACTHFCVCTEKLFA
jgi:ADP-heptose:LPS heptosyltransferase